MTPGRSHGQTRTVHHAISRGSFRRPSMELREGRQPAEPDRVTSIKEAPDGTWDVQTRDCHGKTHVFRGYLDNDDDMTLLAVDRTRERRLGRSTESNGRGL